MSTAKELAEKFAAMAPDTVIAVAIWRAEDVQMVNPGMSWEDAEDVLYEVEDCHDCNYGITWDHLRRDDYVPVPTKKAKPATKKKAGKK